MYERTIAVLGAGWLGLPLIKKLTLRPDTYVKSNYRRESGRAELIYARAEPFLLDLPRIESSVESFLVDIDYLVITLPPGGRTHGKETSDIYLATLRSMDGLLKDIHVIYTSSTGVYGKYATGVITEESPLAPDSHSAQAVAAAEDWLSRQTPRLTILRLAGLYGPGREPENFFRTTETIPNGDAPVNLVHRNDVIQAIENVIGFGAVGTFNVCAASHPCKRDYYGKHLSRAGITDKAFLPGGADYKRIDSTKIRKELAWMPKHDNLSM